MTLTDFLKNKAKVHEVCAVRDQGWVIFVVWIDEEDLFKIPDNYGRRHVVNDVWGKLPIQTENGIQKVSCHYIDIK